MKYDVIIIGSGPAGLGCAFYLIDNNPSLKILILEKNKYSSGGLRNDCKQNYTYPIGFPQKLWKESQASYYLDIVKTYLQPIFKPIINGNIYRNRARKLNVEMVLVNQYHVGTDKTKNLIDNLIFRLKEKDIEIQLNTNVVNIINVTDKQIVEVVTKRNNSYLNILQFYECDKLVIAPGRNGYDFLQNTMKQLDVPYNDNVVDIGIRLETKEKYYPIVKDYYDPKFIFSNNVRTFCTNSGCAYVTKEQYSDYFSINGHSFSNDRKPNNLVNFALLKTIYLTHPVSSGHKFASILGQSAMELGGNQPIMQRVGDFRLGQRSEKETFNNDLYNFKPTLNGTCADISLVIPAKILKDIWASMKQLDAIVPGILYPSTIMYYPEIKTYALKPKFIDDYFQVKKDIYMVGDGAGTSRGITAAWASGIKVAQGILFSFKKNVY